MVGFTTGKLLGLFPLIVRLTKYQSINRVEENVCTNKIAQVITIQ